MLELSATTASSSPAGICMVQPLPTHMGTADPLNGAETLEKLTLVPCMDIPLMVSETGSGFTWYGNSQRNRLTGWSNDPVLDPSSEALYIRDEESGAFWSPTAGPIREETAYRARHGAGYTVFEHNSNGIEQELTIFVPVNEHGGEPQRYEIRPT